MYKEFNINPRNKKTGDCAIRAVALATRLGWDTAYKGLADAGFKVKTAMNDIEAIEEFLVGQLGWKVGTIRIKRGDKRPKVREFAEQNPNIYAVLRVAGHITCCAMGTYVDIWDCGDCAVYKYWYIER